MFLTIQWSLHSPREKKVLLYMALRQPLPYPLSVTLVFNPSVTLHGDQLVTCPHALQGLKNQTQVKLNIVSCPPVTTVLIKRPDLKYQLGFSVQNGIVSLPHTPCPGYPLHM